MASRLTVLEGEDESWFNGIDLEVGLMTSHHWGPSGGDGRGDPGQAGAAASIPSGGA